jgi:hypothetical protein
MHRDEASRDRGATLIEFSLVFMFLMVIAMGAYEWGMAFRDSLAVSSATREAARVGGAVGDRASGDCIILEAAAGALTSISGNQVNQLWVFKTDGTGGVLGPANKYRPSQPTDNPASLICGTWFPIQRTWIETTRDIDGTTRDWLGVRTIYDHAWKTGFLWWSGSSQWSEDAVMHLEPSI